MSELDDIIVPDDVPGFLAAQEKLQRRSNMVVAQMRAKTAAHKAGTAQGIEDYDVRDEPELEMWSGEYGYRAGYSGRPVRFLLFHEAMRKAWGEDYPGLNPRYYESFYVGGHMRGEHSAVAQAAYAIDHGETRPPHAPVVWDNSR